MTNTETAVDINAYANITAYRDVADSTFLCDWVAAEHLGGHDWCPTVLEAGDEFALIVQINPATDPDPYRIVGRYCIGCGYHLFGTPVLEPVRRKIIGVNVATLIDAPKHRDAEIEAFAQEEAKAILQQSIGVRNGARWSVAFALGYRQSEALGMRWKYLDLEKRRIQVWQLKRRRFAHGCADPEACVKNRHTKSCKTGCVRHARYCPERKGGEWVFRPPKGGKTRWSAIPEQLIPQLRAQKAAQSTERLAAGNQWEDWDLVFAGPTGRPINPRRDWAEFKSMLKAAGLRDARPHDARHTAATLLLEQGVDIRVVQEILGHSTLAVTKRYTHVTSKLADEAAAKIGKALWA